MKQLGTLDTAFVNLEQGNTPQHVGGLGIYDPSTAPGGLVRFKQVIESFERRLAAHPLFRTRLVEVPGGIDRPYWVKDPSFDVEFHLRHIALPEPGDWRQLCIQVARLHARPLDMSRPLWEAYIIEGLDNIADLPQGSFAVYTKMHHSLVDGAGGTSFMSLLHDLEASPASEWAEEEARLVDRQPSDTELLARASVNTIKNSFNFARGTLKYGRDIGKYLIDIAREEIPAPDIDAPKTILNRPVGPHRVFDAAQFPLQGFKDIKNAGGVTINDVALALVGGALRRYMDGRGEEVEGSLAAGIPMNMRVRRDVNDENNQVGAMNCSLHTDITDPMERLRAVRESATLAKQDSEVSPLVEILRLAGAVSPNIARTVAGFWSRNHLSQYLPVNISTVVTNVPGPNFALYCAGARMVGYYGMGVLTPGMGIFHAVFSYSGTITLSVLADRDIIPDPEVYRQCLVDSYEELHAAAVAMGFGEAAGEAKVAAPREKVKSAAAKKTRARTKASAKSGAAKAGARAKSTAAKSKAKAKSGASKTRVKAASKAKASTKAKAKAKTKAKSKTKAKAKAGTARKSAAGNRSRPVASRSRKVAPKRA